MYKRSLVLAFAFSYCLAEPSIAADKKVSQIFAEANLHASQEKSDSEYVSEDAAKQRGRERIKQIESLLAKLDRPEQLVELISMCKEKVHLIPSRPKFEPYFGYLESIQKFAIRKLGTMTSPEAVRALEQVGVLESGKAAIMESWDEAKEHQNKLLSGK
jgi:hypothetical protein